MSNKVRVGVVGTSGWADFMYLSSLHSYPTADLVSICGRNQGHAKEMAAKYNIPQVFADYNEMITQGELDMIIVGAPDDLHYAITMQALRADLHVLCDKPLALTVQQAQEMFVAAEKTKRNHMVLFTYRYMPFFRYVHDLISQGLIGRCYTSEFRYLMGYARKKEYQWRLDQKRANGALGDLGVHMIDMARWLVGDIASVSALSSVFVDRPGAEGEGLEPANDSTCLLVEFDNGAQGMIHASLIAELGDRFMQQQVKLYGDGGSLEIDIQYEGAEAGVVLYVARHQDERFQRLDVPASYWGDVDREKPFDVFTQQPIGCRAFIDAIIENRPITPNFNDGYKAQQVIDAAMESHRSGNWVTIQNTL
jgi:predicted dehydrogenase